MKAVSLYMGEGWMVTCGLVMVMVVGMWSCVVGWVVVVVSERWSVVGRVVVVVCGCAGGGGGVWLGGW